MAVSPAVEAARLVDSLGAAELAKAHSYTVGSEWLTVGGTLVSVAVAWLIIRLHLLDWVSTRLGRLWPFVATTLLAFVFLIANDIVTLPWTILVDWKRETDYGLTNQPLGDFLGQLALSGVISAIVMGLIIAGIYSLIRRAGKRWWLWASGLSAVVTTLLLIAGPPLIEPLFNEYTPVPQGEVRTALEEIADQSGIPHDRIFMYDGSRQSDMFTANVSGIGPSARIAISDVALDRASLAEVKAVTAHEAGHYVIGHVWRSVLVLPLLAGLMFFLIDRLYPRAARLLGSDAELSDPRGLPVLVAMLSVLSLLMMPITNALTRVGELEADTYSLDHAREPDALATALLKTAEYRYPRPNPLEEIVFYTHPSVEKRVTNAMEWKAEHGAGGTTAK